ncbi:MAG: hypothetical protein ACFHWZ_05420 [Phycisphaerales bacterium]
MLLVIDELGGRVDEACARSVARCLRRWLAETRERGLNIRVIVSTHRAGAIEQLRPGTHVHLSTLGDATVSEADRQAPSFDDLYTVTEGDRADLLAQSPLHYRPGAPATVTRVLRCFDRGTGELAGVLGVSLPTLNASWRDLAWPGRYRSTDPRGRPPADARAALHISRDRRTVAPIDGRRERADPRVPGVAADTRDRSRRLDGSRLADIRARA